MKDRQKKLAAVEAVIRRAGRALRMAELLPRVEAKLKQVIGRQRLYNLLANAASKKPPRIVIAGRADDRTYDIPRAA